MDFNGNGSTRSIEPLEVLADFYTNEKWKFHRYFYSHVSNRVLSEEDATELAKDLTQDTFTLAVRHMNGEKVSRLKPYVWKIAQNRLKMFYKADGDYLDFMHNTRERDIPFLHNMNTLNEELGIIFKIISKFEKKYRDAIILHHFYQVKYDQIAQMNGVMLSTAKGWAHKAKRMLADRIREVYFPKSKTW